MLQKPAAARPRSFIDWTLALRTIGFQTPAGAAAGILTDSDVYIYIDTISLVVRGYDVAREELRRAYNICIFAFRLVYVYAV